MQSSNFPLRQYLYTVLGILVSVVLPLLRKLLPSKLRYSVESIDWKTYVAVGAFSFLTAILVVAFGGDEVASWAWYTAVLAGYAWDATLQKIVHG